MPGFTERLVGYHRVFPKVGPTAPSLSMTANDVGQTHSFIILFSALCVLLSLFFLYSFYFTHNSLIYSMPSPIIRNTISRLLSVKTQSKKIILWQILNFNTLVNLYSMNSLS